MIYAPSKTRVQWKMSFTPNTIKQYQEVLFFKQPQKTNQVPFCFNHNPIQQVPYRQHLGIHLDTTLNFQEHLDSILSKVRRTTGLLLKIEVIFLDLLQLPYAKHSQVQYHALVIELPPRQNFGTVWIRNQLWYNPSISVQIV